MNCLTGLSITLIAIVAGMLLLAKTQKDNLGTIYKVISYFVIISGFLALICGACCGVCRLAHCGQGGCSSMEKCSMMGEQGMEGGCCKMMGGGGRCSKMGMGCGMMGMKKHCKKMCTKGEMMTFEDDDDNDDMDDVNVEIIQKKVEKEEKPSEPAKK